MIKLTTAHSTFKTYLKALERTRGKLFWPQSGQVMYAPTLERMLMENPQQAVNKIGFFFEGKGGYEFSSYTLGLQCLLTYPEAKTDDDYAAALAHADDFVAAVNDQIISGLGLFTRADGPSPIPNMGVLGIRIDFTITTIP